MNTDKDLNQDKQTEKTEDQANETEFKVTVCKLEMPVRPRGVLAE